MKLQRIERGYSTVVVEIDERDIPWLNSGIRKLLEEYPNSDPLIDLLFELREIAEKLRQPLV